MNERALHGTHLRPTDRRQQPPVASPAPRRPCARPAARGPLVRLRRGQEPHERNPARSDGQRVEAARRRVGTRDRHRRGSPIGARLSAGVHGGQHLLPRPLPVDADRHGARVLAAPYHRVLGPAQLAHRDHRGRPRRPSVRADGTAPHAPRLRRRRSRVRAGPIRDRGQRERQPVRGDAVDARRLGDPRRLRDLAHLRPSTRPGLRRTPPRDHERRRDRHRPPLRVGRRDRRFTGVRVPGDQQHGRHRPAAALGRRPGTAPTAPDASRAPPPRAGMFPTRRRSRLSWRGIAAPGALRPPHRCFRSRESRRRRRHAASPRCTPP
jgi:hypothetical protein